MSIGKVAVLAVALVLVSGGVGAAVADWNNASEPAEPIELVDVDARKAEDDADGALVTEEEGDGDDTAGDDGTAGGNAPATPQPEPQQQAAGDGDQTAGDDGTDGGDNTAAQPAPVTPAPAGADDTDDQAGGGVGGGGGGGDTDDGGAGGGGGGGETDDGGEDT